MKKPKIKKLKSVTPRIALHRSIFYFNIELLQVERENLNKSNNKNNNKNEENIYENKNFIRIQLFHGILTYN